MNLKDRGILVGDLLLILIFVISTFFIIKTIKNSGKQSYFYIIPNEIMIVKKN